MIKDLIRQAKDQFAADYNGDEHLEDELNAFEEGMITAFKIIFDESLHGSISFDLVLEGESISNQ